MHLQEPEILFLVHEWRISEETRLVISRLLCEFLWGDLWVKVVPETDYLSRFWMSPARVPQVSLQEKTLLWLVVRSRSLRIPEEQDDRKKRDVEQSAPTHARPTHCTPMQLGTTADRSKMFLGTDFKKCAKWQGSIEEPAAKDFAASKVRTINQMKCKEPAGMQSGAKSSWEVVWQLSSEKQQSTLFTTRSENPCRFQSRAVLHRLSRGLCHARKMSVWGFRQEERYDLQSPNGHLHKKSSERKAERGKNAGTNLGTRFPRASFFEKMPKVCQKHGGACTTWYPEYERYENGIRNWSPAQLRKVWRH